METESRGPRTQGIALLLALAAGVALGAQEARRPAMLDGFEASAGFSGFHLKPSEGSAQTLNGALLGGRAGWGGAWSVEGLLLRQTGTDAKGVDLRQWSVQAGPRYTWNLGPGLDGFAHALAGVYRLQATQGLAQDRKTSPGLGLGLGLEGRLGPDWALRGGVDAVHTRYATRTQRNWTFYLGVACRL